MRTIGPTISIREQLIDKFGVCIYRKSRGASRAARAYVLSGSNRSTFRSIA